MKKKYRYWKDCHEIARLIAGNDYEMKTFDFGYQWGIAIEFHGFHLAVRFWDEERNDIPEYVSEEKIQAAKKKINEWKNEKAVLSKKKT